MREGQTCAPNGPAEHARQPGYRGPVTRERQGEAEFLAAYDPKKYPRVAVTVDVVLLTVRAGRLSVLLVQRDGHPYRGHWALPGGFVEPDDDLAIEGIGGDDGILLAFDHAHIVADGVERARAKLEYTTLATAFLDEPFTLGELRRVYEAVWGQALHEGNFRRKVLSTAGFVDATGRTAPTDGRPAALYRRGPATQLHPPILRP